MEDRRMKNEPGRTLFGKAGQQRISRRWLFELTVSTGILVLFLTGCAGTTSLGGSDNGKTITVHVGDEVDIALDSNPTTGFDWAIDKSNDSLLALKQSDYSSSSNAIGSGGTRTFKFMAKGAGTVDLQLKYWRSFEGDRSVTQRFAVTVQIQA
jgi:inhibitor of cysteine peptidase